MRWNDGLTRPVTLDELGQRYRRYRLADPDAEEAMAGSLRRWGQLSPVVACVREEKLELIDGFKRFAAARQIRELTSLSVRVLEVDEPTAKAAILSLNRDQRPVRELEEAWVVQGLVRDDGMTQVEAAHLLGRHKSWVCRRLALVLFHAGRGKTAASTPQEQKAQAFQERSTWSTHHGRQTQAGRTHGEGLSRRRARAGLSSLPHAARVAFGKSSLPLRLLPLACLHHL